MKKSSFLSFFLLGVSIFVLGQQLEVAGAIQSDSLSGVNSRVVQTNASGEIMELPEGNIGDFLKQGQTGPQWVNFYGNTSPTSQCVSYTCPTEMSQTSNNDMPFGECLRYCYNLDENGHTDWRTPSIEEFFLLLPQTPLDPISYRVWTTTTVYNETFTTVPSDGSASFIAPRQVTSTVNEGYIKHERGDNNTLKCKCVR